MTQWPNENFIGIKVHAELALLTGLTHLRPFLFLSHFVLAQSEAQNAGDTRATRGEALGTRLPLRVKFIERERERRLGTRHEGP